MGEDTTNLRLTAPVEPTAPTNVRHALHVWDQLADGLRPDLELLVTELVSNVVRHAGLGADDSMQIHVQIEPEFVRAEVYDPGTGWPEPSWEPAGPNGGESGYGLYLVSQFASRWGIDENAGTTVWFELDRKTPDYLPALRDR